MTVEEALAVADQMAMYLDGGDEDQHPTDRALVTLAAEVRRLRAENERLRDDLEGAEEMATFREVPT